MATLAFGPSPNDFVTLLNLTISGRFSGAAGFVGSLMLFPVGVRKEQAPAQAPQLVAADGDHHDDDDDGKDGIGMSAAVGDVDEVSQTAFGVYDLRQDDPAPADAVDAAQMVPDIRLRDGEQDMAHQLPLGCTLGHG